MFDPHLIIDGLARNRWVFEHVLVDRSVAFQRFRPEPGKWHLLEIVCHLEDEEREDFRTRVRHALAASPDPAPSIDPQGWVTAREYDAQDYATRVQAFLRERDASVDWLRGLVRPDWQAAFHHPRFGPMSAQLFLSNWLAHDLLHLRQIIRNEYRFTQDTTGEGLDYAGPW